jgi:hypothetical protein
MSPQSGLEIQKVPIPKSPSAPAITPIARLISPFVRSSDDDVSEWRPVYFAFGVELFALFGPAMLYAAIMGGVAKLQQSPVSERRASPCVDTPAPEMTGLAQSAAAPAKAKKARQIKPAALAGVGDVREWHSSQTTARLGHRIRCNEAYSHYVEWCENRRLAGISLTTFGKVLKNELGVGYVEERKRGHYTGIALKGGPALKIVSSA